MRLEKLDPDIMRVALLSKEAGEALPKIGKRRGKGKQAAQVYKCGMHLGNWTDGNADGITREAEALLPNSILFMDNVKHEAITKIGNALRTKGCTPKWFYRPYYNPEGGTTGPKIQDYANTVKVRMGEYMQSPIFREAYEAGRVVLKIFNETNIGGEGFNRGRAGFAAACEAWKTVRAIVRAAFPKAKFMSIANTPGNDDVWFTGDTPNAVYWYHGPQAAKANPTQAEMQAAIASAGMREMFELADYIGIHVYANLTSTVSGNLQTWYSRRHEQALKFLQPYIAAGKKLVISECDMMYDEGQEARARGFIWWMVNVIGSNDAIETVQLWWNCAPLEGAWTWAKHFTRDESGNFFPIIPAIADYRNGTYTPPNDPPPPDDPEPQPTGETEWIGFIPEVRAAMTYAPATVATGRQYWFLKRIEFVDYGQSGGLHAMFFDAPQNTGDAVRIKNQTGSINEVLLLNEPKAKDFPMWAGNIYTVNMEGLPSDTIAGMQMFQRQHVLFRFTWEKRVKEGEVPEPTPEWQGALMDMLDAHQVATGIRLNPRAAIQQRIFADGFVPVVNEKPFSHPQRSFPATQKAERLNDGAKRYYTWSASEGVRWYERAATPPDAPVQTFAVDTSRQSPNFDNRPVNAPHVVILHHTGGGLASSLNWLCNRGSGVSAHYVVGKKGEIYRLVDEGKRAWHAGASVFKGREDCNDYSIGIEIENAGDGKDLYPAAQLDALTWLLSDIARRRGITRDNVTTHKAVAVPPGRKSDPRGLDVESLLNRVYERQEKAA